MINKKSLFLFLVIALATFWGCKPKSDNPRNPPPAPVSTSIAVSEDFIFINAQDDDPQETVVTIKALNATRIPIPLNNSNVTLEIMDASNNPVTSSNFTVDQITTHPNGSASFLIKLKSTSTTGIFTLRANVSSSGTTYPITAKIKVKDASQSNTDTRLSNITFNPSTITIDMAKKEKSTSFAISHAHGNRTITPANLTTLLTSVISVNEGTTDAIDYFTYSTSANTITITAKTSTPTGNYIVTVKAMDNGMEVIGTQSIALSVENSLAEDNGYLLNFTNVSNARITLTEGDPKKVIPLVLTLDGKIILEDELANYNFVLDDSNSTVATSEIKAGDLTITPLREGFSTITVTVEDAEWVLTTAKLTVIVEAYQEDTSLTNITLNKSSLSLDVANSSNSDTINLLGLEGNTGKAWDLTNITAKITSIEKAGVNVPLNNFDITHPTTRSITIKPNANTTAGLYTISIEYEDTLHKIKGVQVITLTVRDSNENGNTPTDTSLSNITLAQSSLTLDLYKPSELATITVNSVTGNLGTSWNLENIIATITKIEQGGSSVALNNFDITRSSNKSLAIGQNTNTKIGSYQITLEVEDAISGIRGNTIIALTISNTTPQDTALESIILNESALVLDIGSINKKVDFQVISAHTNINKTSIKSENITSRVTKITNNSGQDVTSKFTISNTGANMTIKAITGTSTIGIYTATVEVSDSATGLKGTTTIPMEVIDSKAGYRILFSIPSWTPTPGNLSKQFNVTLERDGAPVTVSDYRFAIATDDPNIDFGGGLYINGLWVLNIPKGDYRSTPSVNITLTLQDTSNLNVLDDDGKPITATFVVILGSDLQ